MSGSNGLVCGTLELQDKGYGFLRNPQKNYGVGAADAYVSAELIRKYGLRGGETVAGPVAGGGGKRKKTKKGHRTRGGRNGGGGDPGYKGGGRLVNIESVEGQPPEAYACRPLFKDLTVIDPKEPVRFEVPDGAMSMRIVDLMTPIGKGQRGLIVAAPRTGKTVLLQQMAAGVAANHPELYMMVLLVDERPEEVTDMRRTVRGEVVASSNDLGVANHVRITRLMIERAKRMLEGGQEVLILLDSLTRLGRAFNAYIKGSGRIMSGGLDIRALEEPKQVFGAARNIENGGSLTIIASCLIDTGSRMDELIFNEFKGTGNMEIMLDRNLANKRIWPAINLQQSGTRKEELLLSAEALAQAHRIRRTFDGRAPDREMEELVAALAKYPNNHEYVKANATSPTRIRTRRSI